VIDIRKFRVTLGKYKRAARTAIRLSRTAARMSRWPAKVLSEPLGNATCFVLGNGPSLKADLQEVPEALRAGDIICVNGFAESGLYGQLKPKYCVFADPMYWSPTSPAHIVSSRDNIFGAMLDKTTWPLTVYVPFEAKGLFEKYFSGSNLIRVEGYNKVGLAGEQAVVNRFFDLGLGMPSVQNVMIAAIFLALRHGYKKVILLGADHSWHETITLDEANRVCFKSRHFFGADAKLAPLTKDGTEVNIFTMGELFHALAITFDGYWELKKYSEHLGAEIVNASSVSYIDAFKRKPLTELLAEAAGKLSSSSHE
jgi:hypothetical protein